MQIINKTPTGHPLGKLFEYKILTYHDVTHVLKAVQRICHRVGIPFVIICTEKRVSPDWVIAGGLRSSPLRTMLAEFTYTLRSDELLERILCEPLCQKSYIKAKQLYEKQ